MGKKIIADDIIGMKFGKLSVQEYKGIVNGKSAYRCTCECGRTVIVRRNSLLSGNSTSCGNCTSITKEDDHYVRNHGILPSEIRHQLYQWVDSGHDVHDNPWGIRSTETGFPCGYLEALSILESRRTWMAGMKALRE